MQSVWHIDFDNGDDHRSGLTQATAIKTFAKFLARVGKDFTPEISVDIYCYGDNKPEDPICIDGFFTKVPRGTVAVYPAPTNYALVQIRFHAMTPRTYYTGAFTAVQVADYLTNTPYVVTDTNMKGANETPPVPPPNDQVYWYNQTIDWFGNPRGSNHDHQRIRIVSGPRAGAVAWTAAANLGAAVPPVFGSGANGAIRTSNFGLSVPFAYTANFATVGITPLIPQVGDPFVVEELPLLHIDRLVSKGNGDFGGSGLAFNGFNLRIVNGGDSQSVSNQPILRVDGGSLAFVDCNFDFAVLVDTRGAQGSFAYFLNCSTIDGIVHTGDGFCYVDAGQHHLALISAGNSIMLLDADAMITTGAVLVQDTGRAWISSVQVWDLPGHSLKAGIMCHDHGTAYFFGNGSFYGANRIWGVDQTGGGVIYTPGRAYAIASFDNGRFFYNPDVANIQNLMTMDGHVRFFGIGRSWENGEMAVTIDPLTMLPTTLRDTSKANLFAAILAGGFGGRAVDPQTGGLIASYTSSTKPTA